LVTVLAAGDRLVIASAKGILDEAGIPFHVLGDEISRRGTTVGAFVHPWCRVQVARDRETEARALLRPLEELNATGDAAE